MKSPHCNNSSAPLARVSGWLRIAHARGLGYSDRRQILEAVDFEPERLFKAEDSQGLADALGEELGCAPNKLRSWIDSARRLETRADLHWLDGECNTLLTLDDPRYPCLLKEIEDPPLVLYVTGDVAVLDMPQLAIVGSRNATPGGMQNAKRFAGELAAAGLVVTSGLAIGIDGAAHGSAIEAGGRTVAVMATGANRIYPSRHRELAKAIVSNGAVVSEFRCDTPARPSHFARRNRLISGLSLGTLIVEGAEKSGSLITARLAATQGRDVFAVPGPAGVSQYRGCHRLIRQGAILVEDAAQLIVDLGWRDSVRFQTDSSVQTQASMRGAGQTPEPVLHSRETDRPHDFEENCQSQHALLAHIGYSPVSVDALATTSGFTIARITADIITLEVQGFVNSLPGGFFVRCPSPPHKEP